VASIALTRITVYRVWRAANKLVPVLRPATRGESAPVNWSTFRSFDQRVTELSPHLPNGARAAIDGARPDPATTTLEQMLMFAWVSSQELGRIAIGADHVDRCFLDDWPSLDAEHRMLRHTTSDDVETPVVPDIARDLRLDIDEVRRVLCRWLDDKIAYVQTHIVSSDEAECFLLEESASQRLHHWDKYEEERKQMLIATIDIPFAESLPGDFRDSAIGTAVHHDMYLDEKHIWTTPDGLKVQVVAPEHWTGEKRTATCTKYIEDLIVMLRKSKADDQAAVQITNYHANQVAAQGEGATAIGNTLSQTVEQESFNADDQTSILEELRRLRAELSALAASSIEHAKEMAIVVQAEEAAEKNDRGAVRRALSQFGAKA